LCELATLVGLLYAIATANVKQIVNNICTHVLSSTDMMYSLHEDVMRVDEA